MDKWFSNTVWLVQYASSMDTLSYWESEWRVVDALYGMSATSTVKFGNRSWSKFYGVHGSFKATKLYNIWLVGGLECGWIMIFHSVGNGMSSSQLTNSIIFQRGRYTTNQISLFHLVCSNIVTFRRCPLSWSLCGLFQPHVTCSLSRAINASRWCYGSSLAASLWRRREPCWIASFRRLGDMGRTKTSSDDQLLIGIYNLHVWLPLIRRKFRSQTSDNMDSCKSRGGKSQRREEKRRRETIREEKESEERRCRCVKS